MSDTKLNVFIQNLKDTTTVLQQLELCIKNLKEVLNIIDEYNVDEINDKIDNINDELGNVNESLENLWIALPNKQDKLTAGNNITINNNIISATNTTYTSSDGIVIENNNITPDTSILASKSYVNSNLIYKHKIQLSCTVNGLAFMISGYILSKRSTIYDKTALLEYLDNGGLFNIPKQPAVATDASNTCVYAVSYLSNVFYVYYTTTGVSNIVYNRADINAENVTVFDTIDNN